MIRSPFGRQLSSLWGAALAVALATTFLSTLLLGMGQVGRSLNRVMAAGLGEAAIVVEPAFPLSDLSVITSFPGVSAAHRAHTIWCALTKPGTTPDSSEREELMVEPDNSVSVELQATAPIPELETVATLRGNPPGPGEIGLTAFTAATLGVELGEEVSLQWYDHTGQIRPLNLVYRSTLAPPSSFATNQMPALVSPSDFDHVLSQSADQGADAHWAPIHVAVSGQSAQEVAAGLRHLLGEETAVYTADSWAENRLLAYTGTDRFTTSLTLSFAALGVAVAGLVVATTFHVLVTRRTWELAIQRCMGATRRQLRNQVLLQALLLGSSASAIGVAAGHVIGQSAALVAQGHQQIKLSAPGLLVSTQSVFVPLLIGISITLGAALPAARRASRTSPLAAMSTQSQETSSTTSLLLGGALVTAGISMLLIVTQAADSYLNLGSEGFVMLSLMGIGGAIPLMSGLVIASHPVIAWAIQAAKPVLDRPGGRRLHASTRIALLSITRSSARAGTTIGAVVVGVSLAIIVATGARTAQSSLSYLFTASNPFDIEAIHGTAVDDAALAVLSALPGVNAVAAAHEAQVALRSVDGSRVGYGLVNVGKADQITRASSDAYLPLPQPGELLVSQDHAEILGLRDADQVALAPLAPPASTRSALNHVNAWATDLYFPLSESGSQLPAMEYLAQLPSCAHPDCLYPTLESLSAVGPQWDQAADLWQPAEGTSQETHLPEATLPHTGEDAAANPSSDAAALEAELDALEQEVAAAYAETYAYISALDWERAPTLSVRVVSDPPVINVDLNSLALAAPSRDGHSPTAGTVTLADAQGSSLPTLTDQRTQLRNSRVMFQVDHEQAQVLLPQIGPKIAERTNGQMPAIEGPVTKLQAYHVLIDRVLTLLVGLLFVAVVIAFVGVTNALMLSVVERSEELATLRALGMSRRQVRLMLAIEGVVLSGAGVVVGVLGGIPLGLLGSYAVLSRTRVFVADVPWDVVGITMLAALLAGVGAAVLATLLPIGKQQR